MKQEVRKEVGSLIQFLVTQPLFLCSLSTCHSQSSVWLQGWGSDFTAQESTSSLGPLLLPVCTLEDKSWYMEKGETF